MKVRGIHPIFILTETAPTDCFKILHSSADTDALGAKSKMIGQQNEAYQNTPSFRYS